MKHLGTALVAGMLASAGFASSALADVKAGVDAWAQGDYARAIAQWRPLAAAGDPDALFNLGQAYKLGRGVPADLNAALDYYRKATEKGHLRAEDNYGLLLFQQNRRAQAMPYLQRSAQRGEPRAQYLVGTALFNGDLIARDRITAYAYMSLSAQSGLPQASNTLALMDQYLSQEDRLRGAALARQIETRAMQLASAQTKQPAPNPLRAPPSALRTAELPPSQSAGTAVPLPPAAPPVATPVAPAAEPVAVEPAAAEPAAVEPAPAPMAQPAAKAPASDKWRVQLGAFGEAGRAEKLWKSLSDRLAILSGYQRYLVTGGNVTRLQAGPLATRSEADKLCATIKNAGAACIVKPR